MNTQKSENPRNIGPGAPLDRFQLPTAIFPLRASEGNGACDDFLSAGCLRSSAGDLRVRGAEKHTLGIKLKLAGCKSSKNETRMTTKSITNLLKMHTDLFKLRIEIFLYTLFFYKNKAYKNIEAQNS